ncbi:hypothetical protein C2S51_013471 [Perilla frutescens var. frutescens]|nr:hypothetical protein C2S51_013471 [Perilla frutescens var. frutescens]
MGILQSTTRFLTSKPNYEEEEVETPIHQDLQNHYISSSERFLKLLSFPISIYKALKFLILRVGFAKLRKAGDPLLPVQNPASSTSTEPLLAKTSPISSPITTFSDEESECDYHCIDDDIDRILLWCEDENYPADRNNQITDHHAVNISVPELTRPLACEEIMWAAVFAEEERKKEEREEVEIIKSVTHVLGEERWIKHYSSRHRILLVGEGDFSFSACLAAAFGASATNIIATSLDSIAFLKKNYGRAMSNIAELRSRGSKAMHEIDATEIANHELLRRLQFDRIIFNFPFAGFFPDLSPECQLRCHRSLVSQFLENAKDLLSENGEIHVSHKTNGRYHAGFKLENIAASRGLRLIAAVEFKCSDYPGYNTKYGFGGDKNFNCYPSKTFKFGLN